MLCKYCEHTNVQSSIQTDDMYIQSRHTSVSNFIELNRANYSFIKSTDDQKDSIIIICEQQVADRVTPCLPQK